MLHQSLRVPASWQLDAAALEAEEASVYRLTWRFNACTLTHDGCSYCKEFPRPPRSQARPLLPNPKLPDLPCKTHQLQHTNSLTMTSRPMTRVRRRLSATHTQAKPHPHPHLCSKRPPLVEAALRHQAHPPTCWQLAMLRLPHHRSRLLHRRPHPHPPAHPCSHHAQCKVRLTLGGAVAQWGLMHLGCSAGLGLFRALYEYTPQEADELALQEGDEVVLMEKADEVREGHATKQPTRGMQNKESVSSRLKVEKKMSALPVMQRTLGNVNDCIRSG